MKNDLLWVLLCAFFHAASGNWNMSHIISGTSVHIIQATESWTQIQMYFFCCFFVCSQIWSKLITNYLWLVYHLCWFQDYAVSLLRVMLAFTFCDSSTVHITPSVIWINGEVAVRWVIVTGHQSTGVHKRKTAEASKTPYFFPSYFQTAGTNVFQSSVNSTNHRGTDRFISDLGHLQSQIQAWFFVNANSLAFMSLAWIQYLAALS